MLPTCNGLVSCENVAEWLCDSEGWAKPKRLCIHCLALARETRRERKLSPIKAQPLTTEEYHNDR